MLHRAFVGVVFLILVAPSPGFRQDALSAQEIDIEAAKEEASQAIAKEIESYVAAFNAKDTAKLLSHWTSRGVHSNETTGAVSIGHEAMKKRFTELFAKFDDLKLEVKTDEIEFIGPSVAIEHGVATVTQASSGNQEKTEYSAVFVFRDDRWWLDRISDNLVLERQTHQEHLQQLDWAIGTWVNQTDGVTIEFECKWTQDNNHISRAYRVIEGDNVEHTGLQIIGWDAKNKNIRSWLFDSDGGFVEGTWKKDGDNWLITSKGILPDGGEGTAVNVVRVIDEDQIGYRKTKQVIDGVEIPDSEEIVIQRQK